MDCSFMVSQGGVFDSSIITLRTSVGFQSIVNCFMIIKPSSLAKRFVTLITFVRFVARMNSHVCFHRRRFTETFPTCFANERTNISVNSLMRYQRHLVAEELSALVTPVWSFSGVH